MAAAADSKAAVATMGGALEDVSAFDVLLPKEAPETLGWTLAGEPPACLRIASIMPQSWASAQKLKVGSEIVAINGVASTRLSASDFISVLRPEQRPVKLTLRSPMAPPPQLSSSAKASRSNISLEIRSMRPMTPPRKRRISQEATHQHHHQRVASPTLVEQQASPAKAPPKSKGSSSSTRRRVQESPARTQKDCSSSEGECEPSTGSGTTESVDVSGGDVPDAVPESRRKPLGHAAAGAAVKKATVPPPPPPAPFDHGVCRDAGSSASPKEKRPLPRNKRTLESVGGGSSNERSSKSQRSGGAGRHAANGMPPPPPLPPSSDKEVPPPPPPPAVPGMAGAPPAAAAGSSAQTTGQQQGSGGPPPAPGTSTGVAPHSRRELPPAQLCGPAPQADVQAACQQLGDGGLADVPPPPPPAAQPRRPRQRPVAFKKVAFKTGGCCGGADHAEHGHQHQDHGHQHHHGAHEHGHDHHHGSLCAHEHGHEHHHGSLCAHEHGHEHHHGSLCAPEHGHEHHHGTPRAHEHGHEHHHGSLCAHEVTSSSKAASNAATLRLGSKPGIEVLLEEAARLTNDLLASIPGGESHEAMLMKARMEKEVLLAVLSPFFASTPAFIEAVLEERDQGDHASGKKAGCGGGGASA
eukprot:TRINITY_DN19315_c0_g1_i3.p1 TRINITY_DN19315_c0_g1~~TRINITY_DN19315_c0_g1_i3.p1  ORF type:complete len:638 (+),score=154.26 TRINITY_DN19315_c0_g1_i3:99-2012(+)